MDDGKPKSKLAALAAARRKKENLSTSASTRKDVPSAALLDRLTKRSGLLLTEKEPAPSVLEGSTNNAVSETQRGKIYPIRKQPATKTRNDGVNDTQRNLLPDDSSGALRAPETTQIAFAPPIYHTAAPSDFARTICASTSLNSASRHLSLPFVCFAAHAISETKPDAFAGPSPDDIVIKAQSSKGFQNVIQQPAKRENPSRPTGNPLVEGVTDVSISDKPKVKSKNLDVAREFEKSKLKSAASFVVIGHVDAGKSTLMGRLLHDLNVVDQRTIDKYRREATRLGKSSFALAWVLDEDTEERARGVTIDIATNYFSTDSTNFTILDAPGHQDFIPNMIAGAAQADFALLVIDADTGNFESGLKGQTREHVLLVRSMGVQRVVIAINKLDAVEWSQDRFDDIQQQMSAFLTATGFQPKNLSFVPCSGLTGDNILQKSENPAATWYDGPTLIATLEPPTIYSRALEKPLRMTIDDVFRGGVQSPISIIGRIEQGTVQIGDLVLALPASSQQAQQPMTIKSLILESTPTDWAVAGQTPTLNLTDVVDPKTSLRPGDVICHPSSPIPCVTFFKVKLLAFEHIMPMQCEILRGRLRAPGRVAKLVVLLDKASGAVVGADGGKSKGKKKIKLVKPGEVARVVVEVDEAIPLDVGGRVVLRAGGETIGAGLVE